MNKVMEGQINFKNRTAEARAAAIDKDIHKIRELETETTKAIESAEQGRIQAESAGTAHASRAEAC